jgi:hypothetical protein
LFHLIEEKLFLLIQVDLNLFGTGVSVNVNNTTLKMYKIPTNKKNFLSMVLLNDKHFTVKYMIKMNNNILGMFADIGGVK